MTVPKDTIDISVIIPALNEAENIGRCLDAIINQDIGLHVEIIVIDSGSTDETIDIIDTFDDIQLVRIAPGEFGHGRTRNLGASKAKGKYLVFLNADAIPADKQWLNRLLKPLDTRTGAAGVFSRHLPKPGCFLYMTRDLNKSMPDRPHVRTGASALDMMIFSTVSCVIPRDIWNRHRFDDDIVIAEDQEWAKRVLAHDFQIIYQSKSRVYHSHNYTPKQMYRVKFDVGRASGKFNNRFTAATVGLFLASGGFFVKTAGDFFYIFFKTGTPFSRKLKEFFTAIRARAAGFAGLYRGWVKTEGKKTKR